MGRAGQGVDVRESSIRITFTLPGQGQQRQTLMMDGKPMAPTPANLKYAARLAAEIRDRIRLDSFSMAEYFPASGAGAAPLTVGAQLDAWLAAQRLTKSTRQSYSSMIKWWKNVHPDSLPLPLGDKPLRALKHSDILTALATQPEISGKTVNNRTSVLREACDMAILDGALATNPVAKIKSAKWQKPPVDPFTADEVERILEDMRTHHPEQVWNYVEAKFFTGLRTGESFGLHWANVDLKAKQIVVLEGITAGEKTNATKTSVARTVRLNSRAAAAFERQRKHSQVAGKHVFLDPRDGNHWTGEPKFRMYWMATLKRLQIRHRPPYNTRHTYATLMLMNGLKPAFCAGQMGHSVEIFYRTYAKWIPGAGDDAEMAKLEAGLGGYPQAIPGAVAER